MKTYKDESKNARKLMEYFESMSINPSPDTSLTNYLDYSNLVILKNRLEIKKKLLLSRGFPEYSDEVKKIDDLTKELREAMKKNKEKTAGRLPKKEYYVKKEDAIKIVENIMSKKDEIVERVREMPLISDVHIEPYNKSLYYETVSNYWMGNFNASICMLSVFLESFLKDIYYLKEGKYFEGTLIPLIQECLAKKFIEEEEGKKLHSFADTIRNKYLHANIHQILPEAIVPAYKVDLKDISKKPEPTYLTADKLPALRSILKSDIDKTRARELVLEIVALVEELSKRHSDS